MHEMNLLVLAGGFGTRLRTAVPDVPKVLASVHGVPFLQLQIEHWLAQGLSNFTFLLHHQADQVINFLKVMQESSLKGCQVDWLIETTPLDTGGAIAHAIKDIGLIDDFLMTNADTWLGGGMRELMESTAPAMAVVKLRNVSRYGQVYFDQGNHVTTFEEKNAQSASGWINAGLCRLSTGLFKDWNGQPFSLERELFGVLAQSRSLTAVPLQVDFIDIGIPSDYHRFCRWVGAGRRVPLCN